MRLEELMVGDIIFQHHPKDNTPHIVKVSVGTLDLMDRMKIGLIQEQSPLYRIIEPIPLTPEILEKNNFLKVIWQGRRCTAITTYAIGEGFNLEEDNDGFNLVDNCSDSGDYGYESNYICDIKYVHELQHALKLCGIEKTIEL